MKYRDLGHQVADVNPLSYDIDPTENSKIGRNTFFKLSEDHEYHDYS